MTRPARTFSIRAHLLLLAAVSALPPLVFGAVLLWRLQEGQMASFGRDVVAVTRALSLAIDSRIGAEQAALQALARSPALARGDLQAFAAELQASASLLETHLSLSGADGRQLLDSRRPGEATPPARDGLPWLLQAVQERQPVVSDIYPGPGGQPVATLEVPVLEGLAELEGSVRYVLSGTVRLSAIDAVVAAQRLPPRWLGAVLDRQGRFVSRTRDGSRTLGQPASQAFRAALQSKAEGWERTVSLEGASTYAGFTRSERTGWVVAVGTPADVVWGPLWRGLLRLLAAGAVLAALGAAAALWIARRIARPVSALPTSALPGLATGPATLPPSGIKEVDAAAAALHAARAARDAADAELQAATDLNPQRPWTAGPDGRLLTSSKRVTDLAGVGRDALLGDGWLHVVHPDDRAGAIAAWSRSVRTGALYSTEFRVRNADGSYVWTHARAAPRLAPDGTVLKWYGSTEAIQARKEAEAALRRSQAELQALASTLEARVVAEVAAREAAQDAANARIAQSQRMQALGQLASGIAHDFNNVLQAVSGGLALIGKRPGDPALVSRIAGMAADATARGAAITGRLLSLSRKGELRTGPVDAATLLDGLREVLAHTLGAGVPVQVEVAPGLPPFAADRGQLETVLINLATNARDAMPGGGTLTLFAALHEAGDGEGVAPGRYVRVGARDTGAGMAPEVLARAREPFFTTKEVGRGTGLGLSMAHGFAELSGGRLDIRSAPGAGTSVSLLLPCTEPAPPGVPAAPPAPPPARARLLLVDDDALVRGVTAAQLADLGFDVAEAADGAQALALLDGPDGAGIALLVSDLAMPGMDGMSLIRAVQARRALPAILLTGYAGDSAAALGAPGGPFGLMQKPVTVTALAHRIAALLGEKNIP